MYKVQTIYSILIQFVTKDETSCYVTEYTIVCCNDRNGDNIIVILDYFIDFELEAAVS